MRDSIMLYKHPGPHEIHGDKFDYIIVHGNQMDSYLAQGWSLTTDEAKSRFLDSIAGAADEMDNVPIPEDDRILYAAEDDIKRVSKKKRLFSDLDEFERLSIKNDKRSVAKLCKIHNTTAYTVRKIKGKT